jgi:putative ABC transport system permease protein
MKHLLSLALASASNRRFTLGLTTAAIALSVAMLLGVERTRNAAHESFAHSISGTDLVVGPRTSPVQLMLYAVFRLGEATNGMRWTSYQEVAGNADVAWAIPLSIGDSHRGFPVVGTTIAYFEHYRYGLSRPLELAAGRPFKDLFDTVLGAEVAERLGYRLGDRIKLGHGTGEFGVAEHSDKPFTVVGVLARTGTPVDRSVHTSLEAMEAIHLDWQGGVRIPGLSIPAEHARKFDIAPKEITAALVGLKARSRVFQVQRAINNYAGEPLMAVLPGLALTQLWGIVDVVENTLLAVSGMIVVIGLSGMIVAVWAGLNERRRELAILRSVGAGPGDVVTLLALEGLLLTIGGVALGYALLTLLSLAAAPLMQARFGVVVPAWPEAGAELALVGLVFASGLLAAMLPALHACRLSLADGLTPRL